MDRALADFRMAGESAGPAQPWPHPIGVNPARPWDGRRPGGNAISVIIAVALGVIVVASVLLWLPVLGDHLTAFLSKQGNRYGPRTVLIGLVLLIAGLVGQVRILAIIGGVMAGVVIFAAIVDNY